MVPRGLRDAMDGCDGCIDKRRRALPQLIAVSARRGAGAQDATDATVIGYSGDARLAWISEQELIMTIQPENPAPPHEPDPKAPPRRDPHDPDEAPDRDPPDRDPPSREPVRREPPPMPGDTPPRIA